MYQMLQHHWLVLDLESGQFQNHQAHLPYRCHLLGLDHQCAITVNRITDYPSKCRAHISKG